MFGGKALGERAGTLIWMLGVPGARWANIPSLPHSSAPTLGTGADRAVEEV